MGYTYTADNRIDHPHYYMYTPYEGAPFLEAYLENRRAFIAACRERLALFKSVESNDPGEIVSRHPFSTDTGIRLSSVVLKLLSGEDSYDELSVYVRKFEVSRKLCREYDAQMKAVDRAFDDPEPYILLAFACGLQFRLGGNLKFLNCLLKLGDLVVSCLDRFDSSVTSLMLAIAAVELEVESVRGTSLESGVRL